MAVVTVRPDALEMFAAEMTTHVAMLMQVFDDLDRVRHVYVNANPDYWVDAASTVENIPEVAVALQDLASRTSWLAAAARQMDVDYRMGPPLRGQQSLGMAVVDADAWASLAATLRDNWATTGDLRTFMRPLSEEAWNLSVFGQPGGFSHVGGVYRGGGVIVGPDGLDYPIVVPEVSVDGVTYRANGSGIAPEGDVLSLQQSDPGWVTTDTRVGVTRVQDDPSAEKKSFIAAGLLIAPHLAPPSAGSRADLGRIAVDEGGRAWVVSSPSSASGVAAAPVPEDVGMARETRLIEDEDGRLVAVDPNRSGNRHVRRQLDDLSRTKMDEGPEAAASANVRATRSRSSANVASASVDLATGGAVAVVALRDVVANNHRVYQVVFESNDDGRRRALVRFYGLPSGELQGHAVSLDEQGELVTHSLTHRPASGPTLSSLPVGQRAAAPDAGVP